MGVRTRTLSLFVECKNQEKVNVCRIRTVNSKLWYEPVVVIKKNHKKPLVVVDAEYFVKLHQRNKMKKGKRIFVNKNTTKSLKWKMQNRKKRSYFANENPVMFPFGPPVYLDKLPEEIIRELDVHRTLMVNQNLMRVVNLQVVLKNKHILQNIYRIQFKKQSFNTVIDSITFAKKHHK